MPHLIRVGLLDSIPQVVQDPDSKLLQTSHHWSTLVDPSPSTWVPVTIETTSQMVYIKSTCTS